MELFIEARTLSCAHTLCNHCITEHLQRKDDCPNCRAKVGLPVASITVTNMVESTVSRLPAEEREERKKIVQTRMEVLKEQEKRYEDLKKQIEVSKKHGHVFYSIKESWKQTQSNLFLQGLKQFKYIRSRKLYADMVGLGESEIAQLDQQALVTAAKNLKMKSMENESIVEQRRRLTLFVYYGTKMFLSAEGTS
mmetsp:Transcript_2553/g.4709  ORF Transcript_2553/g.4709 Transcript_2553/m.4709 type:complete len:194 (-) Transcript_2553:170-751(-)